MKQFIAESIGRLDLLVWILVMTFFCGSSWLFDGKTTMAFIGAAGVIVEMLFISIAIEIIIECLKNTRGIGTITGFITNGPEAVCLLVGLVAGDIIFAASTPLGSNFMNPILLFAAALVCKTVVDTLTTNPVRTSLTLICTASLAGIFFFIPVTFYLPWVIISVLISGLFFYFRPAENGIEEKEEHIFNPTLWLIPAVILLTVSGYYLDPVVTFAAEHSHAPKGVIGFFVLSTLTSWPEFKSCLALLKRRRHLAAILNITVSNITNIWLAVTGIVTFLILQ